MAGVIVHDGHIDAGGPVFHGLPSSKWYERAQRVLPRGAVRRLRVGGWGRPTDASNIQTRVPVVGRRPTRWSRYPVAAIHGS